jgi:hypothetical protein
MSGSLWRRGASVQNGSSEEITVRYLGCFAAGTDNRRRQAFAGRRYPTTISKNGNISSSCPPEIGQSRSVRAGRILIR